MKKIFARSRVLLVIVALVMIAAMSTVSTAHAASPQTGGAASRSPAASASSTGQCTFVPALTCQSTDPIVALNIYYYGGSADCAFVWDVDWGDGHSTSNLEVVGPANGYRLLAQHTYLATETYTIAVTGLVTVGNCVANAFTATFTLQASPPAPSRMSGKACVFNAPKGGFTVTVGGEHISGHVGWAYMADPASGIWEYGANEGPINLNPKHFNDVSRTWRAQGTWSDVLTAFKGALPTSGRNKGYYHPGKYYETYRCVSVTASHPAAALRIVKAQADEVYSIPDYDCLAQVVEVLATYGAPISEHAYLLNPYYWVPNHYYESGYMSKFGSKKPV